MISMMVSATGNSYSYSTLPRLDFLESEGEFVVARARKASVSVRKDHREEISRIVRLEGRC